jgi:hypothetical protein
MADVGDGHQQAPALARLASAAVEQGSQYTASSKSRASSPSMVTSGTSVQVHAALRLSAPPAPCRAARAACASSRRREAGAARSYLRTRDLDLHARVVELAQHLGHAAHGLRSTAMGGSVEFHHHHLARPAPYRCPRAG